MVRSPGRTAPALTLSSVSSSSRNGDSAWRGDAVCPGVSAPFFRRSRSALPHDNRLRASVHFKRGTTRGASLRGRYPASSLLSPPPTPAPARTVFGCALAKRPEVMRFGCGPPPLRGRSPELRPRSVSTCRPDAPAAAPCRLRPLLGVWCQPSSDAQRLGLRSKIYRGSYGFTGVTARRFATATPCEAGGLTRRT